MLACAGAACAAVLAGCSKYNSNNGGVAGSQPAPAASSSAAPAGSGSGSGAAAGPAALASTSDIPVGGGKILTDKKIVITQPQSGAFHAFSAVCTHAGCTVGSVSGGTINCPCHGSRFNITNGAVVNGPAASPLPPVSIKVQGNSIVPA
jgi:nitrite reductase/ring-hydroxylating ferredoxin subunit